MLKPFLRGLLCVLLIAGGGLYLNSSASLQEITLFGEINPFLKGGSGEATGDFVQQPNNQPDNQPEDNTNLIATDDSSNPNRDNTDFLAPGQGGGDEVAGGYDDQQSDFLAPAVLRDSGEVAGDYTTETAEIVPLAIFATSWTGSHLFITTWDTRNTSTGSTDESTLKIPTGGSGYSGQIDWGDGTTGTFNGVSPIIQHTYATEGIYQIKIQGNFPRIYFSNGGDRKKLLSIDQWGTIQWTIMGSAFMGCENLQILAVDAPNLNNVKDISAMFRYATHLSGNIEHWNTSGVTNMSWMFATTEDFTSDLSTWDVSKVTSMAGMFHNAKSFNGSLSGRNTTALTGDGMGQMFQGASSFNQPLDNWNVENVTSMKNMFNGATNFNGSLNGWDTRSLTGDGMLGMFQNASNFNQPVNHFKTENITSLFHTFYGMSSFNQDLDKRNVSNVTNMQEMFFRSSGFNGSLSGWNTASLTGNGIASMFENATSFNQPVNHFKTNNITSLNYIFRGATVFNQPLNNWDVSKVTSMANMFQNAKSFNGSLSGRDTTALTGAGMLSMFNGASDFNQPVNHFKIDNVTSLQSVFNQASSFNQPLDNWDVNKVTTMASMFNGATNFNGSLSGWNTASLTGNGITNIFQNAKSFNQPVNHFKTNNITMLYQTFEGAKSFNQPLDNWNVSNVYDFRRTFYSGTNFDQPLNNRDISNATNLRAMFTYATNFNQPLDQWGDKLEHVQDISRLFQDTNKFNQNINNWDVSNITGMFGTFYRATAFNQPLNLRTPNNVIDMKVIFYGAANFNQDISSWNVENVQEFGWLDPNTTTYQGIFDNTNLSTYNYNAILSGWSVQNLNTGLTFGATPIQYGGCNVSNRAAGITGREKLIADKGRTITDAGLADCAPVPSYGGGGGGGVALKKDDCPNGDFSSSYYDETCDTTPFPKEPVPYKLREGSGEATGDFVDTNEHKTSPTSPYEGGKYEIQTAYDWAFQHHITTLSPIEDANLTGPLLRSHLAKMIVNYVAITPSSVAALLPLPLSGEENKGIPIFSSRSTAGVAEGGGAINAEGANTTCTFSDLTTTTNELQTYITLACQLGLMGIHSDGTPLSDFMPNKKVTRAEFGTVLSRLLYGTTYNNGTPYYLNHLQALKEHGIMTQITNPEKQIERRQRVRLMLMRASKQE